MLGNQLTKVCEGYYLFSHGKHNSKKLDPREPCHTKGSTINHLGAWSEFSQTIFLAKPLIKKIKKIGGGGGKIG